MKLPTFANLLVASCLFFTANVSAEQQTPTVPMPVPPGQKLPGAMSTGGMPGPLVSAAATLFAQGLADPRGGEYREVRVETGTAWPGDNGTVLTHGWVMPLAPGKPPQAVCWNGLSYPAVSVSAPADLNADVAALITPPTLTQEAAWARYPHHPVSERGSMSEKAFLPLKACLLLRLGQTDLARRYWAAWTGWAVRNNSLGADQDPYRVLATDWIDALFDRAVNAHKCGKDSRSLADARQLTMLQPMVDAEAKRRGYVPLYAEYRPNQTQLLLSNSYFAALDAMPPLLADEARRVADTAPQPSLPTILAMPDKTARLTALIRALDQLAVSQTSEPGRVEPDDSPIVQALIAMGNDAVEPLIQTLAADTRLTRSVGNGRGSQPGPMLSVAGAAYAALQDILHTTEFSPVGPSLTKAETAAAIRAYWTKFKGLPLAERWYRTLADDTTAPAQWLEAAHEIIRLGDEQVRGGWIEHGPRRNGLLPSPQGEALRRGHLPTVSALMARRIAMLNALSGTHDHSSQQVFDVENATTLALYLTAWDPQAARSLLAGQFSLERRTLAAWQGQIDVTQDAVWLTRLTLARTIAGDSSARTDYMDWLQRTPLPSLPDFSLVDILEPLWCAPDDPTVRRSAAFLFNDPRSSWMPLLHEKPTYSPSSLLESPLLRLDAFRRAILSALADKSLVQTITLGGQDRQADYNIVGNDLDIDPFRPTAIPRSFPVRQCDVYAWHLAHLGGMPSFKYDWPTAKKDAAISVAAARLRRYGANFALDLPTILPGILPGEGGALPTDAPRLSFPHLTRPATPPDVAENKALFALGTGSRVRPLPTFPLAARWVTDHRYPRQETVWTAPRTFQKVIGYAQDGYVWQAEKATGGRCFYGFVGPHDLTTVPAEEMEFPPSDVYSWTQIAAKLDCELQDGAENSLPYLISLKPGEPLTLTVHLRSRRGVPQMLPADFLRRQCWLNLLFSADDPDAVTPREIADPSRTWAVVPPHQALLAPFAPARRLDPAEEFLAWTLNPETAFDLSRPGTYRLQFVFTSAHTVTGRQSPEAAFRVTR